MTSRLEMQLKNLALRQIVAHYQEQAAQAAQEKLPYEAYLARLVDMEAMHQLDRALKAKLAKARFPAIKTMEEFDFSFQPQLNEKEVLRLTSLDFVVQKENVLFLGPPGVGKTHLAIKGFYGYKSHMVQDADSEFLVQAATTPGNVPDGAVLPQVAQPQAQEMTGDKAYDSKTNQTHLADLGVSCGLVPRRPRPGRPRKAWRERPKIERKFAECKQFHGLRRARYWGLAKVAIQTLMVALVVNLKRWVTLLKLRSPATSWAYAASP